MFGVKGVVALVATCVIIAGPVGYLFGVNAEKARAAIELQQANQENAETQKELMRAVERVASDAEQERQELEQMLDGANDAVSQLQHAVNRANANSDSSTASSADASIARSLLAECAAKYRDLAAAADQQRLTILGLRSYVSEIQKALE